MGKQDLTLNNLHWFISHKTKPNRYYKREWSYQQIHGRIETVQISTLEID